MSTKKLYKLIDKGAGNVSHVRIVKGHYTGLVVSFGEVKFIEDNDSCTMAFAYEVHENPYSVRISENTLKPILGDILLDIIMNLCVNEEE